MIRAHNLRVDSRTLQFIPQTFGYHKVIDTPSRILFPCPEPVRPPGINIRLIGIEITESIDKSILQQ